MLTSSGGGGRSMLTVADRGEGGKICQNLADVILCERFLMVRGSNCELIYGRGLVGFYDKNVSIKNICC